jgi:hypothetical protein
MSTASLPSALAALLTLAGLASAFGADQTGAAGGPKYALREFKHGGIVWAVAFSPDGQVIAGGGDDRVIQLWDGATGKSLRKITADGAVCLAFSPDGKLLASAPGGGAPRHDPQIWDAATGQEVRRCAGHSSVCYFVAFSPDGKLLASASVDQTVKLWDVATGKEVRTSRGHQNTVLRVAFAPDGKTLASVSDDHTVRLWDVATGRELKVLNGHSGQVLAVNLSPDGRLIASGGGDGTLRLWDVSSGKQVRQFTARPTQQVSSVAFSRDGRSVAAGLGNKSVALIEVLTGGERYTFDGHQGHVYSVAFSPDGKALASGGGDGSVRLWDYKAPGRDAAPDSGRLGEGELAPLWQSLMADDAGRAYRAIGTLAGTRGDEVVAWMKPRLKPAAAPAKAVADEKRIARLIADLDDDDFEVREKASESLRQLNELAGPAMRQALEKTSSAEVRRRLERLLERLDNAPVSAEELLAVRGVEVLERIGSPAATEMLQGLAKGHESARLTREAKAALERLSGR